MRRKNFRARKSVGGNLSRARDKKIGSQIATIELQEMRAQNRNRAGAIPVRVATQNAFGGEPIVTGGSDGPNHFNNFHMGAPRKSTLRKKHKGIFVRESRPRARWGSRPLARSKRRSIVRRKLPSVTENPPLSNNIPNRYSTPAPGTTHWLSPKAIIYSSPIFTPNLYQRR